MQKVANFWVGSLRKCGREWGRVDLAQPRNSSPRQARTSKLRHNVWQISFQDQIWQNFSTLGSLMTDTPDKGSKTIPCIRILRQNLTFNHSFRGKNHSKLKMVVRIFREICSTLWNINMIMIVFYKTQESVYLVKLLHISIKEGNPTSSIKSNPIAQPL